MWWNGIHSRLKICRRKLAGSNPASRTKAKGCALVAQPFALVPSVPGFEKSGSEWQHCALPEPRLTEATANDARKGGNAVNPQVHMWPRIKSRQPVPGFEKKR